MAIQAEIGEQFLKALRGAEPQDAPYRHWILNDLFPADTLAALQALPFPAPDLEGVSGTREVHNASRVYLDVANQERYDVCREVAAALQDRAVVRSIGETFGADLDGTYLRIEHAQDTDGFWLEPHTDIGVKRFTLLGYISGDPSHADLGTDIYADKQTWFAAAPFMPNVAMVFVPSNHTWHGFRKRPIKGVRKSIIINYVTSDWRAREQLCFPEEPVSLAAA